MAKHFEELWVESEKLSESDVPSVSLILFELKAKLSVYEALDKSDNIPEEERHKLKSHTFGKILASLTQLSLKDNINSFTALANAINDIKIEQLEAKYQTAQ